MHRRMMSPIAALMLAGLSPQSTTFDPGVPLDPPKRAGDDQRATMNRASYGWGSHSGRGPMDPAQLNAFGAKRARQRQTKRGKRG